MIMTNGGGVMLRFEDAPVVEPIYDQAATTNARLVNELRARLLKSGTAVTIDMIAEATGKDSGTVRQRITRHRKAGRLITVSHDGRTLVPTAQLDEAFDLDHDAAAIVARLVEYGMDGWSVWDWLETPNAWLGGDRPAQRLAEGDTDAVHRAVSGLFQE